MAKYRVLIKPSAAREIEAVGPKVGPPANCREDSVARRRSRPPGYEKLAGQEGRYRIRSGRYRVIYSIGDVEVLVVVVRVGHRREVYR
ncbi:MAG TPA: type II toxin-antitoxin system RelE/ParE family toxin [Thermoanaerobaculia bacterium]|nr:type II toxin-antitoxin system RelE/ParE family toxin [Thermoanaerobaculia bacterium]